MFKFLNYNPEHVNILVNKIKIKNCNKALYELFEVKSFEEFSEDLSRYVNQVTIKSLNDIIDASLQLNKRIIGTTQIRTYSGKLKDVQYSITDFSHDSQLFSKILVALIDVTETTKLNEDFE